MLFSLFVFLVIIIILSFLLPKAKRNGKNILPPGPLKLPFKGNFHQFDSVNPHTYFLKLSKKYGKIFSLKFCSTPVVVISSAKLAKEVMKTQDLTFCSRPSTLCQKKFSYNGQDIASSPYNDNWKELRKICVTHLFSKVQYFVPIREDKPVSRMIKEISQQAVTSRTTNLSSILISLTTTIICRVAFGIRYDEETRERRNFNELLKVTEEMLVSFFVSDFFPLFGWIDNLSKKINILEKNFKDLDEFYEGLIEQHLSPPRPHSMEKGDIIDLLLQLKKDKSTPIDLTLDNIKAIIMNMLVGGTNTSAATIIWAMTSLIANPNAMKKVQEEIRESVGKKSIVSEDDVQNLPYFKAVIKETFRLYPPAPLLVPRETMRNSVLEGYEIKAKSIIYVNAWAIARDPEIWENPEKFIPERFLNSDFQGQNFELIPFGAGRRGCPAMTVGVATVELVLSNLLYAFDWELPCGMKREDIDTHVLPGLTMHKKKPLCLVPRNYL
uniref:Cytochrome P450 83B1-like protein n=1 Tax=Physalis pubescens TaxID=300354 RepID=A0AA51RGA0_9SOLA|nr:cytochrome P450 83B1-like protein [Physalis pubescens]